MSREESCFVYMQLPLSTEPVVCGRFVREQLASGDYLGRFVYGRSYRSNPMAVPIDPVHLPLSGETYETLVLAGMFGAIRDAAPDAWGRRVVEHALGKLDVGEVEYLLNSPEDRAGALSFGVDAIPPASAKAFNSTLQLADLLAAAEELDALEPGQVASPTLQRLKELVEAGTSMGGARPKNVVRDEQGIWLAKFPARGDRWNNAAVEAAILSLAKRCDIRTPSYRVETVGRAAVLLVKRFDRELVHDNSHATTHSHKSRMVSALTVVDGEEVDRRRWSYLTLCDELQRWSAQPQLDRVELFRRVVLNALVTNTDDHPRNHAVIAPAYEWMLSPVYDVTPNPVHAHERDLAMVCGTAAGRRATRANLLSACTRFGVSVDDAQRIIAHMRAVVTAQWETEVLAHGGRATDCDVVRPAFDIPGFDAEH